MSESGSIDENRFGNSSKNVAEEVPGIHILTQEAVNELIEGFTVRYLAISPARGIDSAGSGYGDNTSSNPLPQD